MWGVNRLFTVTVYAVVDHNRFLKGGTGFNTIVIPNNIKKIKDRVQVLLASKSHGQENVLSELTALLDVLLKKKLITKKDYRAKTRSETLSLYYKHRTKVLSDAIERSCLVYAIDIAVKLLSDRRSQSLRLLRIALEQVVFNLSDYKL